MKRALAVLLSLLLFASPAMAHHAMPADMHAEHVEISGMSEDHACHYATSGECMTEYGEHDGNPCCSSALVHCVATYTRYGQADVKVMMSSKRVFFSRSDDVLFRLMPEQETPPPRT